MKLAVIAALAVAIAGHASADPLTLTCRFKTYVEMKNQPPYERSVLPVAQSLKFVDGKTDSGTLKLDGTARATNSHAWTAMRNAPDGLAATFTGDDGEVLTLSRETGEVGELNGRFTATLINSFFNDRTQTLIGTCVAENGPPPNTE